MALKIEQYALIGDCQTAALVGDDGSIDWLCLPRFDSAACFAALLGTAEHGRWPIRPAAPVRASHRRYRPNTFVLETDYRTDAGLVRLIDFMSLRSDVADVVRIVRGVEGVVPMRLDMTLRPEYGTVVPWVRRTADGIVAIAGPDLFRLRSPVPLVNEDFTTRATFSVSAGQQFVFDLTWSPSHREQSPPLDCERALEDTTRFWTEWADRCADRGEWSDAVTRSALTLKALTYAPTGGIVAAPTTSLPEHLG